MIEFINTYLPEAYSYYVKSYTYSHYKRYECTDKKLIVPMLTVKFDRLLTDNNTSFWTLHDEELVLGFMFFSYISKNTIYLHQLHYKKLYENLNIDKPFLQILNNYKFIFVDPKQHKLFSYLKNNTTATIQYLEVPL